MEIGIVSMYPNIKDIKYVEDCIRLIGYKPYVLDLYHGIREKIFNIIKRSNIIHWIFTGSPTFVTDRNAPQIPLDIYKLHDKKYMMICYSLESIAYQLKLPISFRQDNKKELFELQINNKKMKLWRNHYGYLSSHINIDPLEHTKSYDGECMVLHYKNSILLQFHPERTNDGIEFINKWINNLT
jgi:GMP synthase-like glutamine amidotransferase